MERTGSFDPGPTHIFVTMAIFMFIYDHPFGPFSEQFRTRIQKHIDPRVRFSIRKFRKLNRFAI